MVTVAAHQFLAFLCSYIAFAQEIVKFAPIHSFSVIGPGQRFTVMGGCLIVSGTSIVQ